MSALINQEVNFFILNGDLKRSLFFMPVVLCRTDNIKKNLKYIVVRLRQK